MSDQSIEDSQTNSPPATEAEILDAVEKIILMSKRTDNRQHLSTIGSYLREQYPGFTPAAYGSKNLRQLIEGYPGRFKVAGSASNIWVRMAGEPKEPVEKANPQPSQPKPKRRLMTAKEFARLCEWLDGPQGCNFQYDPMLPDDPEGITWDCAGTLRKTRQWLRRREFLSLEENIKVIKQLGGHCDCEVIFNAAGNWPED